jgi:plasmid stabilization system protein ParE
MIASRSDAARLPRVAWRRDANRALAALLDYLAERGLADTQGRRRQIEDAIESLRYSPLRCQVVGVRGALIFRKLTVDRRFFVYYVYEAPRGTASGGTISIRSVKHAAMRNPFFGVREGSSEDPPLGFLTTRDGPDLFVTV